MIDFVPTPLNGAYVIDSQPIEDERGCFTRLFCAHEFSQRGLEPRVAQISISTNRRSGTLRGLHFQAPPYQEAKTIRCLAGSVYDVIVDLRANSQTFLKWFGLVLSAEQQNAIHAPVGFAHGFVTREDNSVVQYLISESFTPQAARGIRFDDPILAIKWPIEPTVISARDLAFGKIDFDSLG